MTDRKNILIIDDEAPYRVFLRKLFEREGFEVETSASGLVSLDIAARRVPDVVIVDWMLKDSMDGLQVAAELRKRNPEVKTILITGYPSPDLEQQAAGQPQTTYIAKPFESEDILATVIRVLSEGE